ncbi:hypothetical protein C791_7402 [Amycolatopsis azurea DSM 43854]|uniref:Uncharacterized protein n=1 Tax=Amycolatopsis azurea DSM 43854 TaxID=1238180 RepID=M2QB41_9PSEU|nr:hypothetical protein C791_7402 [Amycolatopsis azurea DSM 43854]
MGPGELTIMATVIAVIIAAAAATETVMMHCMAKVDLHRAK